MRAPVLKAGAVAFLAAADARRFVLVTARRHRHRWIFPKGHIEPGETPEQAAVRELYEEAGVRGRALRALGTIRLRGARPIEIAYILVSAEGPGDQQPEAGRRRRWAPYAEAREALYFDDSKRLLDDARRILEAAED